MKRILIISNTYYQLLVAIKMKKTLFQNDYVCLLLSDHSQNAESVSIKLKENEIFDEIHFIKTKGILSDRKLWKKLVDCLAICFGGNNSFLYYLHEVKDLYFDEMIFYNFGTDISGLFSVLRRINNNIKVSIYEEGLFSYEINLSIRYAVKYIKLFNNIKGKKDVTDSIKSFYCFYPLLYEGRYNAVQVPQYEYKSEDAILLRKLFDIKICDNYYNKKYIFFSSVYDFEGEASIGELDVARKIRDIVGNENLLVKIHPRDFRSVYEEEGFYVDINSSIPWEVTVLSENFSGHVFLTVNSGSALAASLMTDNPVDTIFLYKCCNVKSNSLARKSTENIENIIKNCKKKELLKNVKIIDRLEEIIE